MKKKILFIFNLFILFSFITIPIKTTALTSGSVKNISIIKQNKIKLDLENADPTDKTITLCSQNKTSLEARYDKTSGTFFIADGYLSLGTNYKVIADWVKVPAQIENISIPVITSVKQISPTQIQITFDRDVEYVHATNPRNYWVRDTNSMLPTGIASIGRVGTTTEKNTLKSEDVKITSLGGSKKHFTFTFKKEILKNIDYKLQASNISCDGFGGYSGDNYDKNTTNTFTGQ